MACCNSIASAFPFNGLLHAIGYCVEAPLHVRACLYINFRRKSYTNVINLGHIGEGGICRSVLTQNGITAMPS